MGVEVEQDITHVLTVRDGKLAKPSGCRNKTPPDP
jgi:hypothetical protein